MSATQADKTVTICGHELKTGGSLVLCGQPPLVRRALQAVRRTSLRAGLGVSTCYDLTYRQVPLTDAFAVELAFAAKRGLLLVAGVPYHEGEKYSQADMLRLGAKTHKYDLFEEGGVLFAADPAGPALTISEPY